MSLFKGTRTNECIHGKRNPARTTMATGASLNAVINCLEECVEASRLRPHLRFPRCSARRYL